MAKVAKEVAKAAFEKWLDFKKISAEKRESSKEFENTIISGICSGELILNENHTIDYKVNLESDSGEIIVDKLTFKPRIRVKDLNAKMQGLKADDAEGRVVGYVAAVTGQNRGVIANLYIDQYAICQSIVMYFL